MSIPTIDDFWVWYTAQNPVARSPRLDAAVHAEFVRAALTGKLHLKSLADLGKTGVPDDLRVTLDDQALAMGLAAHIVRFLDANPSVETTSLRVDEEMAAYLQRWLPEEAGS